MSKPYRQIHMNWSECSDWNAARHKVKMVTGAACYGNFAVATTAFNPDAIAASLRAAGFKAEPVIPAHGYDASFRLTDAEQSIHLEACEQAAKRVVRKWKETL